MAASNRQIVGSKRGQLSSSGTPKKILVATDFSSVGNRALAYAMSLGRVFNAHVVLVHVVPPVFQVEGVDAAALAREGEAWARRHVERLKVKPEQVSIVHGPPVETILREAKKQRADLIVVGSRGLSRWKEWVLGSVAHRLLQMADRPVLVVSKRARLPKS